MRIFRFKLAAMVVAVAFVAGLKARGGVLLSDNFNTYADGELQTVGAAKWTRISGTSNDLLVSNHAVVVDDDKHDDDSAALSSSVTSGAIYESFTITGGTLDSASGTTGDYLTSFIDSGSPAPTSTQEGRIFAAKLTGSPPANTWRLGVSNIGSSSANITYLGTTLSANTTYTVVMKWDMATSQATMWLNPTLETDSSITATDAVAVPGTSMNALLIRQGTSGSAGDYVIDNVVVGTTFADVVPEPASLGLAVILLPLLAARRRRA